MRRSLVGLAAILLAGASLAIPPPPQKDGVVYDATTHRPLPGVVITAHVQGVHNPKSEEFSFAPHVVVAVTDALGRYSAGYMNVADVVFAAAGYDTLKLCWPYDLKKDDPCAGLVDVFLSRTRDVKQK